MTSRISFKLKGSRSPAHQQVSFEGPSITAQRLQALIGEKLGLDARRDCIMLLQPGTSAPYPPGHEFAPNDLVTVQRVPLPAASALAAPRAQQAVAGAHHPAYPDLRGVRPPVGNPRGALPEAQVPAVAAAAAQDEAHVAIPPPLPAAAAPAAGQVLAAWTVQEVDQPVTPMQVAKPVVPSSSSV